MDEIPTMGRAQLTELVRRTALKSGAALVGFAPISRFENAPSAFHPRTIFASTKTVVAIAVPQPRGALKAIEDGTYWQAYNADSYWLLNEVKGPMILRDIIMALEEFGHTSVPVHNPFHQHSGRQIRDDQPDGPDGVVSLRVLGVAAGLGELGMSKVFLTPEFGPRQRVFGVFTDAELDPTPLFTGKVCDDCGACARECEARAIGTERTETFEIDGHTYSHAPLDCEKCIVVHRGEDPRYSPFWNGTEKDGEVPSYNRWMEHRFRHLAICAGRGCIRACLDHLEKTGRIKQRFHEPFTEGERWKLDEAPPKR